MLGMHVTAATPAGYGPLPSVVQIATALAQDSGGSIRLIADPAEAVAQADVLYTDTLDQYGPGG